MIEKLEVWTPLIALALRTNWRSVPCCIRFAVVSKSVLSPRVSTIAENEKPKSTFATLPPVASARMTCSEVRSAAASSETVRVLPPKNTPAAAVKVDALVAAPAAA